MGRLTRKNMIFLSLLPLTLDIELTISFVQEERKFGFSDEKFVRFAT